MKTLLIARRELAAYLRSFTGYVIIAVALAIDGLWFNTFALSAGRRSAEVLSSFFYCACGTTLAAAVFLTMRLLAEERQAGTLPLLYSSPVRDREIVLGKFLSALGFLAVLTLATFFMPLLLWTSGKISLGHIAAGYLGLLLIGSAATAIGTFGSALARNQVLAAIATGCMVVALLLSRLVAGVVDAPFAEVFLWLDLYARHFVPFQNGVIHLRDVVYYLLVTYVALFAATRVLEARRWR